MNSFAEMAQNTMEKANTQAESLEQIGQGIEQLSGVVQVLQHLQKRIQQ